MAFTEIAPIGTSNDGTADLIMPLSGGTASSGSIQDTLHHLLGVEAAAEALVDDAQAEADRRIAEGEKRNRTRFEERYTARAAELDTAYEREIAEITAAYQKQLDEYRADLEAMPRDQGAFSRAVERFLAGEC
jgi:vacuolar-type H+-ATPase subunit H